MPEEFFTTSSHPSVAMTTTDVEDVQTTVTSSSHGADFYFQIAVVFIGVVGAAANALILYAMIVSKQHKKQLLIFNQNVFDLCSCLLLALTYTLKLCNIRLTGTFGYWLCMIVITENLLWCSTDGSVINLMIITVERYLKVVHPKWSKKWLRKWVRRSAMAFAWIAGVAYNMSMIIPTSTVINGVCVATVIWSSRAAALFHIIWYFVSFFVVPVFIFIFCYWHILSVIRRQAKVMASHGGPRSSTAQTLQTNQIQSNVIKTMIIVSAFYVIAWMPIKIYYLILIITSNLTFIESGYYAALFVAFFYVCANPFIYAIKFEPVKHVVMGLIPCKKSQQQAGGSTEMAGTGTSSSRSAHKRN